MQLKACCCCFVQRKTSIWCMQGVTYAAALHLDLCFQLEGSGVQRLNRKLGMLPIMVKSDRCYLRHLSRCEKQPLLLAFARCSFQAESVPSHQNFVLACALV